MKKVMKNAWQFARLGAKKYGGKASDYFASSLRLAHQYKKMNMFERAALRLNFYRKPKKIESAALPEKINYLQNKLSQLGYSVRIFRKKNMTILSATKGKELMKFIVQQDFQGNLKTLLYENSPPRYSEIKNINFFLQKLSL